MANITINTAQNVNLDYKTVNIGERMLAFLIDAVLFVLYIFIIGMIMDLVEMGFSDRWTIIGLQSLLFAPVMLYSLYMHILFQGRTLGKMIMRIKVVRLDGTPVHWSHYGIRWMLRLVDIWLFMGSVGILSILFSEKRQRIGDAAAGTVVISTQQKVTISHTILEEITAEYQPVFTNVTMLSDKDVRLIKETYTIAKKSHDFSTMKLLRTRIETILSIQSDLYDQQFIDTILKDYNYFTQH